MLPAAATLQITRLRESTAANTFRIVSNPPVFVSGEGAWLIDDNGRRYLDLACGSATTVLGHGHKDHQDAVRRVLDTGILHTGTRLPSPFRAELYERLTEILPAHLDCIQLANSGAEAVEAALKAAQYTSGRRRILSFEGGYHGRTLGALSVTHGARVRDPFTTLDDLVDFLPYPEDSLQCDAALETLDARLDELNCAGDLPAALIVEPVQGVSGVHEAPGAFLQAVQARCREREIAFVVDEIWSGFGRAGRWFSFERAGLQPDLVLMGKALSGGLPLSAVAGSSRYLKGWPPGMHTSTFQGNPVACAMAVANIDAIRTGNLIERVSNVIEPVLGRLKRIPGVRVVGAQAAVPLITNGSEFGAERAERLQRICLDEGRLIYAGGRQGEAVMVVPPLIVARADLECAVERVVELATAELGVGPSARLSQDWADVEPDSSCHSQ